MYIYETKRIRKYNYGLKPICKTHVYGRGIMETMQSILTNPTLNAIVQHPLSSHIAKAGATAATTYTVNRIADHITKRSRNPVVKQIASRVAVNNTADNIYNNLTKDLSKELKEVLSEKSRDIIRDMKARSGSGINRRFAQIKL